MIDISIIIPCYNRVDLLKQTLLSVKAAIKNLSAEIILIDDGSDNPISDQLNEFQDLHINFTRQKNSGLTISRYNGMMLAKGEFIQFLDSDDQISNEKLRKQIDAMRKVSADVSHTDILETSLDENFKSTFIKISTFRDVQNPAEFYIEVQPAPHSPIFRRQYLVDHLAKPFIPLSRDYDSIGEVWFYYNLAVFEAKIIKINEPLTLSINHTAERLTNHWERLGLCALSLMKDFVHYCPENQPYTADTKKYVSKLAFHSFRRLPYNLYTPMQYAYLDIWEKLGMIKETNGGRKFMLIAKILGYRNAAIVLKYIQHIDYKKISSITHEELVAKTTKILNQYK